MENSSQLEKVGIPGNARPVRSWQGRALTSTVYTTILCVGIALLLWLIGVSEPFSAALGVSLCIGLSINASFLLLRAPWERLLGPPLTAIALTGVGLGIGLTLAGGLVVGDFLYFFNDEYSSIILGVFFGIVGFTIISSRERLAEAREEVANLRAEQVDRQRELLETELRLLQAQIEPHFLFNTLSNVVGLVRSDPEAAEKTLLNLSTLLRSSLRRTRAESVSLAEEMDIVRAYLEIQAIRMQNRLDYRIDIDEDETLLNWPMPPLIIQPLVENALRHGIDPSERGGSVAIRAHREGADLKIVVADTGAGIGDGGSAGEGTGLSNVRDRLRGLYGDGAGLEFLENDPSGVRVVITIPGQAQ
jgi:LytS/YehU family sensor histidine kinase